MNNQVHAQFIFLYFFIPVLYMFRAAKCSSLGESIVSIVWYMSLYVGDRVVPHGHLHTVTYIRGRIDTIDSPDDEHLAARNM